MQILGQKFIKFLRWFFGKFKTTKSHSEISWPLYINVNLSYVQCYVTFCINWRVKKYIWRNLTLILTFTASATAASAASPNHQQQLYAGSSTLGNSLGHYASLGGSRSAATSPVGGASGTYLQSGAYLVCFMVARGALAPAILKNRLQINLDLRNCDLRKNLDLRKIVATTKILVSMYLHKLFDSRKVF